MTRVDSVKQFACGAVWACLLPVVAPAVAPAQEAPPRPFPRKVIQLDDAQLEPREARGLEGAQASPGRHHGAQEVQARSLTAAH